MRKISIPVIIVFWLLFLACGDIVQDIEFKRLENLSIHTLQDKKAELDGTFVLYNPNPVDIDIRKAHFDVWLDGKEIGQIDQALDAVLPADGETGVSLKIDLDLKEVLTIDPGGILDMGLKLLRKEKLPIAFKGRFTTSKSGLSIPIKVEETIDLSEEIRKSNELNKKKL